MSTKNKELAKRPTKYVLCIERVAYLHEVFWEAYLEEYRGHDYSNPYIVWDYVADDLPDLMGALKEKLKEIETDESTVDWVREEVWR